MLLNHIGAYTQQSQAIVTKPQGKPMLAALKVSNQSTSAETVKQNGGVRYL